MQETITIRLEDSLRSDLEAEVLEEGVSADELVSKALQQYLFIRKFRRLRQEMVQHAQALGIFTDEDIFELVS